MLKIGSASIYLGDTSRHDSACISIDCVVFIHGTYSEMREFAHAILQESARREQELEVSNA